MLLRMQMTTQQMMPVLSAIKHLTCLIEQLTASVSDIQKQIDALQEEWRTEYEVVDEWETASEDSVESAPATFSYMV